MISFTPTVGENLFRDVTTDPVTGKPHKVKALRGIQFDDDPPIETPGVCLDVRLWVRDGERQAIFTDRDTDRIYTVDADTRRLTLLGKGMGRYPAAFYADGLPAIQHDNSRPDYDAFGIHHIEPDGRWVMNNAAELNDVFGYQRKDGKGFDAIELIQADAQGEYEVGKCDRLTNSGIARLGPEGLHHFGQYTQFPPRCNRQGWVAIQGSNWQMTPEPNEIPWIRHEDLPERPAPQLPEMSFPQTVRPIWRGCLGWTSNQPGNFVGGRSPRTEAPIVEGSGIDDDKRPWVLPEDEHQLLAIFDSPHEATDKAENEKALVALAKRTGAPVLLYADRNEWDVGAIGVRLRKEHSLNVVPTIRCYVVGPDDTAEAMMERLKTQLEGHDELVGVVSAIYRSANCDENEAAKALILLAEYIEQQPRIVCHVAFGWGRPQGSAPFKSWAETYFDSLCDRTPEPKAWLMRDIVPPKPEPQPAPVEPKTEAPTPINHPAVNKLQKKLEQIRQPAKPKPEPKLPFRERLRIILAAIKGRKAS